MLDRRSFMKAATALGLGAMLRSDRDTRTSAVAAPGTHHNPTHSMAPTTTLATDRDKECRSLVEIERCADLLDDLDCIEIVRRYTGLMSFSRAIGDASFWRAYCPFCEQRTLCTLEVGHEGFNCEWCGSAGSAIDCYARMEGLSHRDAGLRLEALLDEGTLLGRRPEYEHAWDVMSRAQCFYHELLKASPAGADARKTLADHGISSAMIECFMLGYAPVEPVDLLSRHLVATGYNFECLDSVCFPAEDGTRKMVDRYKGGHLLIPVVDSRERSWGFFQKRLFLGSNNSSHNFDEGWTQGLLRLSDRRLRRLVFPHPCWPRDFPRYERLLLTRTPWEVIALQQAGIDCAVFMPAGPVANDPITRRTLLAMSKTIVCPFDAEGKGPAAAYELFELDGRESCAIRLMSVPVRGGIVGMLRTNGAAALQAAMNEAVPIEQWTG